MTDKYEEFKEFVREKYFPNPSRWIGIFNDFEEECAKKEKEKQVKGIIKEVFNTVPLNEYEVEDEWYRKTIYVPNDIITEIYDKLKEEDLIK